jgi:hypothetical protein
MWPKTMCVASSVCVARTMCVAKLYVFYVTGFSTCWLMSSNECVSYYHCV